MTVIVKGIETRDANGEPYLRKDIDKWYAEQVKGNRIQLTLFVEALALIQKRPLDNLFSYFRLAGIHSAPWCKWDDVELPPEKSEDDPDRIPGYCVHNNYTFPTWHRVYMMLYEMTDNTCQRVLYDAMYEWIDKDVPTNLRKDWKEEADKWRLPYWDFARFADRPPSTPGAFEHDIDHDKIRLPILCMMPNVQIKVFENGKGPVIESRPNPLYKYVTSKLMGELPDPYTITGEDIPEGKVDDPTKPGQKKVVHPKFTYPWNKCNATTKYGILDGFDESIWADGGQNWLRANYALNEHPYYNPPYGPNPNKERTVPTLQDLVNRLFQYGLDSWGAFSTTRYTTPYKEAPRQPKSASTSTESEDKEGNQGKNALNLEFIHNNVHNFVGGSQFLRPPKEEIHLWGSGHMSSVFMAAFDPIFFIFHNNIDRLTAMWQMLNWEKWFDDDCSMPTKCDELWPFHKTETTFWTSNCVQEWDKLGYQYEILQGRDHNVKEDREKVLEDIEVLYGKPTEDLLDGLPPHKGEHDDFVITVIYDKYALNGAPYKINLFLDGRHDFLGPESEGFVASIYNFSGSLESGSCGNCQQQKEEGVLCISEVPATVPMRHHLKTLDKKKDLDWKKDLPQPVYLALNNLGKPVSMNVTVELHRSWRPYYANPREPNPNDPLKYDFIKHGKQADAFSMAVKR